MRPLYVGVPYLERFVNEWLINVISYSILFILGLRMRSLEEKASLKMMLALFTIFIVSMFVYLYVKGLPITITPNYKYPPHSYYILYGMFMCSFLWTGRMLIRKCLNCSLTKMIGQNTVWIYLYHIPLLYAPLPFNWFVKYIIVYGISFSLFCVNNQIYKRYKRKYDFVKYIVG